MAEIVPHDARCLNRSSSEGFLPTAILNFAHNFPLLLFGSTRFSVPMPGTPQHRTFSSQFLQHQQ